MNNAAKSFDILSAWASIIILMI